MLSVCIPHYNFENPLLLRDLEYQCTQLDIIFEIIIVDDGSEREHKTYLDNFDARKNFKVIYLDTNVGRSKTRNLLIQHSQYNLLLFLDGDSAIKSELFITRYLESIQNYDLAFGGRVYPALPNDNFKLHWLYGTKTESASEKNFHSNNFIVKRHVVDTVLFDEDLTEYGYEDVLFGCLASVNGFSISPLDNPVIHMQLKSNQQFLEDTTSAIKNITLIYHRKPEVLKHLNLPVLNFYLRLKKTRLHHLLSITEKHFLDPLHKSLINNRIKKPLKAYMLYKLYVLNKFLDDHYK